MQRQEEQRDIRIEHKDKLYCRCHMTSQSRHMIECSVCGNWFHFDCIHPTEAQQQGGE